MHMVIYLLDLLAIQCISSKSHVMAVSLHMKPQSPSTFVTVRQKETGFIVTYYYYYICRSFSFSTVAIDMHGNSISHKTLSINNNFHMSPYL